MTEDQEAEIRQLMRRRPRQQRMPGWLWTRSAVIELVKRTYGVTFSERGIGNYLAAWGIAIANPKMRPESRCKPSVREWLTKHYDVLHQEVKAQGESIFWVYRAKKLNTDLWNRRASIDPTENVASRRSGRMSVAMAINNQGKLFWMIVVGTFSAGKQAKFINGLQRDAGGVPIAVIRDDTLSFATDALRASIKARLLPTPGAFPSAPTS